MKTTTTKINGNLIEHNDVIFNRVTTSFSIWDRVKLLLGYKAITESSIYTLNEDAKVVASVSTTYVPPLIKRRSKGMIEQKSPIVNPNPS